MTEFALAVAVFLLAVLYMQREARHAGEHADTLTNIIEWMKCEERMDSARDRQVEILTKALTRSENPDSAQPIFCPDHPASFLDDCHHGPTPQEMLALRPDPADRTSDDR